MSQLFQRHIQPTRHPSHNTCVVTKDWRCSIATSGNIHNRFIYLVDFWTTLAEIRWRCVLLLFMVSFTGSWFIFRMLWYWIAKSNGDLVGQNGTDGHVMCVANVNSLSTAFLYSLETQTTIGYGDRVLTGHCPSTAAVIVLQFVVTIFIKSFMCALILAKLLLLKRQAKMVSFSDTAVICVLKGKLCLLIRLANVPNGSQIYCRLLKTTTTPDGKTFILDYQLDIDFMVDAIMDNLIIDCPLLTIYHVINDSSPLYKLSADTLPQEDFELVVLLDGMPESTSTSYIPQKIQWGHNWTGKYRVDFTNFSKTKRVTTPHCAQCVKGNQ
ncbi:ATP-sensitive inward rectifier potassium channel 1-like [Dunckerocampus dactyliophorus]|uniref:ATP-sensitive inward rectifier potassium channel 1-like n=1 Tax=Dunckerocampus dactyliophorus TaxID=161453 RepID=UPI002405051D|nr:ATP-sensitive inward rectifier potassium channel 1-like [Dunckerocampus dactyliophorus]